jgi:hypothetical protein
MKSFMVFTSYQILRGANQGHMAGVQEKRYALRVLMENPEEKRSPGDLCIDE